VRLFYFLLLISVCFSCGQSGEEKNTTVVVSAPEEVNPSVTKNLSEKLSAAQLLVVSGDSLLCSENLKSFYKKNNYTAIWSNDGIFDHRFFVLQNIIRHARTYGLYPKDYHSQKIDSLSKDVIDSLLTGFDVNKIAAIELLATDAFFVLANHLHHGRVKIDSMITRVWTPEKLPVNTDSFLLAAYSNNTIRQSLEMMEPKFEQYFLLKRELKEYIAEHKNEHWREMPDIEKDTAAYLVAVKKRMIEMGFYDSTATISDSLKLSKALVKFQRKCRLTTDGKVGKEMIKALSYTIEKRIRQIELNIERWRVEPPPTEKRYTWVNLPGFNLRVSEDDTLVLESRIICGDYKHPTPLLISKILNILVYPYWNVPYKIASKEILPRIKWDTNYLRKQKFDVLDWTGKVVDYRKINWKKYSEKTLPYKFRQNIGEDNSLGVMKFNFYNKYDVYIHDTNAPKLFGREVRAMSHGCMRLDKYFEFASFLIRDDSLHYRPDSLNAYIERQEQKKINLIKPLLLYVKYFSCEVINNKLLLYQDIYNKDEEMEKLLYN
jgi:murein L,D-transpeptidase YcbB/YkuD